MNALAITRAQEPGLWGRLPLLLAMLAIALQTMVLQPHVHAIAAPSADVSVSAAHVSHAPSALAACVTCRVSASARVFTLPPALITVTPVLTQAAAPAAFSAILDALPASHAWRSRAPPLSQR